MEPDGTVDASSHEAFLAALRGYMFNILIYDGADEAIQTLYFDFIKRMREGIGRKCQAVMAVTKSPGHRGNHISKEWSAFD